MEIEAMIQYIREHNHDDKITEAICKTLSAIENQKKVTKIIDEMLAAYQFKAEPGYNHLGCMGKVRTFAKNDYCIACAMALVKGLLEIDQRSK